MPFWALLLFGLLVAVPAQAEEARAIGLFPPPVPRAEPRALTRAPLHERRPVELLVQGRAWAPLLVRDAAPGDRAALGGAAGAGVRSGPYFSFGAEASAVRASAPGAARDTTLEVAAVGRVYLLEAGIWDPYLELSLGYAVTTRRSVGADTVHHGPSTRAGGGIDLVALSPLRLGLLLTYREVVGWAATSCRLDCRPFVHGGVLAGVAMTLPLGEPL
jgi:hypothetical protein